MGASTVVTSNVQCKNWLVVNVADLLAKYFKQRFRPVKLGVVTRAAVVESLR